MSDREQIQAKLIDISLKIIGDIVKILDLDMEKLNVGQLTDFSDIVNTHISDAFSEGLEFAMKQMNQIQQDIQDSIFIETDQLN